MLFPAYTLDEARHLTGKEMKALIQAYARLHNTSETPDAN